MDLFRGNSDNHVINSTFILRQYLVHPLVTLHACMVYMETNKLPIYLNDSY